MCELTPQWTKDAWIKWYEVNRPECRQDVITFIANILFHNPKDLSDSIYNLFACGYCYYFALMLKDAFGGEICWHVGHSHIVWRDENFVCYDIGGIFEDYGDDEVVPISALTDAELESFRHRFD